MPSRRRRASSEPRSPLARQASASFTRRSLSAALNSRRGRLATVSTAAPLTPSERSGSALSCEPSRPDTRVGLGTIFDPFSAHRYFDFQGELSHVTLARGGVWIREGAKTCGRRNWRVHEASGRDGDFLSIAFPASGSTRPRSRPMRVGRADGNMLIGRHPMPPLSARGGPNVQCELEGSTSGLASYRVAATNNVPTSD